MSYRKNYLITASAMMLLVISLFVISLLTESCLVKSELPVSSVQNFKDYVTNIVKEQSTKIQLLLKKLQTNAQSVLDQVDGLKREQKIDRRKVTDIFKRNKFIGQIESPILKTSLETSLSDVRSFNNHYQTTSFGASGNANYGAPTYHHHSIGFDPINIMVSVSLLSFLLQALQGLLTRTRLPTPVVEAKSLNAIEDWTKNYEEKLGTDKYYLTKKYLKKYY